MCSIERSTLCRRLFAEFDGPDYRLSSVRRKAIRIARLRNDYENLWWLQAEMLADSDKEARNRIKKELLPHYSKDEF
jgi:ABC-type transport system involved in cytochrome c biogenesis ATPase subunit